MVATSGDEKDGLSGNMLSFVQQALRKKDIAHLNHIVKHSQLHRTLDLPHLVSFGIGSVVGAGIFVITGQAAAQYAGPALSLSFLLCAVPCILTGLCYGELASMVPVAGSAYSFTGLALGELAAWYVAMCLTLENLVSAAAVAVGWAASVQALLEEVNIVLPASIASSPYDVIDDVLVTTGATVNLLAILILLFLTVILCAGVQESARFNAIAVVIKISVLLIFVGYGAVYAMHHSSDFEDNLTPYIPPNKGSFGKYGWSGIFRGAGVVFFANVGFDSICSTAQECVNPKRDLPRGLLITIAACTTLYVAVTTVLTGMVPYKLLDVDAPVIMALVHVDAAPFFRIIVEIGTIAGLTSVCLVSSMAMPRLILTVAQDGLLPASMADVNPRTKTPIVATVSCGLLAACIAGLLPLGMLGELVSFGTLTAFIAVCASTLRLRLTHPEQPREFTAPFFPWVPIGGIVSCGAQLLALPLATWRNYAICTVCATIFYLTYSRLHSKVLSHHKEAMECEDERIELSQQELELKESLPGQ